MNKETVTIVARTKMGGSYRCVSGLSESGKPLRLLNKDGAKLRVSAPYQVGEKWEIEYASVQQLRPPHTEDVRVFHADRAGTEARIHSYIKQRASVVRGSISALFQGALEYTHSNNGFIAEGHIPGNSVEYWIADKDVVLRGDGIHYDYTDGWVPRGLKYVGEIGPPNQISSGTLLRVSLARWWKPDAASDFPERCYLQLSGWYDR